MSELYNWNWGGGILFWGGADGRVLDERVLYITERAADSAFDLLDFSGPKPGIIVYNKPQNLGNGDELYAEYTNGCASLSLPAILNSGVAHAIRQLDPTSDDLVLSASLSAVIAHEMTHHVQQQREPGCLRSISTKDLPKGSTTIRHPFWNNPLETEAFQIGEKVVEKLFDINLKWRGY